MQKLISIGFALILMTITGCASQETEIYSRIDTSEKTVNVPAGHKGITGAVRKTLKQNGWEVVPFLSTDARYQLQINAHRVQLVCLNEFSEIAYEIIFSDNKTGEEVFYISGKDCDDFNIASDALTSALKKAGDNKVL
ncbi:hypothetical protein KOI40_06115 [Aestuariicella sp. G3-2]|uniref:hypothetical protein n=1 Tax=Pseudomaricurvus albidus TaxID=2842452 RepID=UPI001C0CD0D9|nr:hypothetical protein [Aestuariicella albida]MBU3069389.1 hypothetical protein [Aestuariicella albida]